MIRKKSAGKAVPGGSGGKAPPRAGTSDPALARVRELAQIATEFDLAEIEIEPAGKVRVVRRTAPGPAMHVAAPAPSMPHAPLSALPAAVADEDGMFISSPFVGTFYRAPGPDAVSFVELGQSVRKGQVVCIIEAMKLMNEIETEAAGTVVEILVENGQPVEFGQPLFRIEPV